MVICLPKRVEDIRGSTDDKENDIFKFLKKNKDNAYTIFEILEYLHGSIHAVKNNVDMIYNFLLLDEIRRILKKLIQEKRIFEKYFEGKTYYFYTEN